MNEDIIKNMNKFESGMSKYACKNSDAYRFYSDIEDMRPPFFRDIDRIIYSLSYTRYIDKTQVFIFNENDNITRRMTHVQLVSKIGRTIGRALNLNEDLIEAAALGHDLGHVPFGHPGERVLNEISLENNEGYFNHNIQSVRNLMYLEDNGKGRNLNIQTLDAIMCHNGEFIIKEYRPKPKTKDVFLKEYEDSYKVESFTKTLVPMTLEGCVVRISDIIAYLGKDIEDAIRLGVLNIDDVPKHIKKTLGSRNKEIVNTIINDVIINSINKPFLKMSENIYNAILELKKFNYDNIYLNAHSKEDYEYYNHSLRTVFNHYLKDLNNSNKNSDIYKIYLKDMEADYLKNNTNERIVLDYISGMTDDFLKTQYDKIS